MAQLGQSNVKGMKSQYESGTEPRARWWSEHLPELFAGAVLLGFAVLVVSCSKFSQKPAAVAMNQPAASAAVPAATPAASIASPPAAPKKIRKHRPSTATYINSDYGVSLTYPRQYSLMVGEKAQLAWDGLGPVQTDFVKSGGMTLAAVELPRTAYPDSDLTSAFVNVSVKTGLSAAECSQFAFPDAGAPGAEPPSKVKVGGIEFDQAQEHTGEAAKRADARYYHVFQNSACYEFTLGVGTVGEAGEHGLMQVDRQEVFSKLEKILATVKIRPAEVPRAEGPVQTQTPASTEKPTPAEAPTPLAGSTLSSW